MNFDEILRFCLWLTSKYHIELLFLLQYHFYFHSSSYSEYTLKVKSPHHIQEHLEERSKTNTEIFYSSLHLRKMDVFVVITDRYNPAFFLGQGLVILREDLCILLIFDLIHCQLKANQSHLIKYYQKLLEEN